VSFSALQTIEARHQYLSRDVDLADREDPEECCDEDGDFPAYFHVFNLIERCGRFGCRAHNSARRDPRSANSVINLTLGAIRELVGAGMSRRQIARGSAAVAGISRQRCSVVPGALLSLLSTRRGRARSSLSKLKGFTLAYEETEGGWSRNEVHTNSDGRRC